MKILVTLDKAGALVLDGSPSLFVGVTYLPLPCFGICQQECVDRLFFRASSHKAQVQVQVAIFFTSSHIMHCSRLDRMDEPHRLTALDPKDIDRRVSAHQGSL